MTKSSSDYPEARSLLRRIAEYQHQISTYDYLRDEYLSQYGRDRATLSAASDDLGAYVLGNYLVMLNDKTLECYFAIADILQTVNDIRDVEASAVLAYIYHRRYSREQVERVLDMRPENVAALHDRGLRKLDEYLKSKHSGRAAT